MSAGYEEYFIAIVFFLAVVIGSLPLLASAQVNVDAVADAMCNPVIQVCSCGQVMGKNGCEPGANMFMCPCQGPHTSGICVAANKCKATSYISQSGQSGGAPGLSQLMQTLGQLLQSLGQGGGGGGGGSNSGSGGGCASGIYQTSNRNITDPCAYYVAGPPTSDLLGGTTGNGTNSAAASELLSSLIGSGNPVTNSNTNTNTNTTNSSSTNNSSTSTPSASPSASVIANISNPQDLKPGTSATVSQSAFGNAPGVTGDIQVLSGNRVTVLASNRDTTGNKQTSGFFGFSTTIGQSVATIYTQACAARQWADNFISFIVPASYFDNLCASHGYAVGPPALAPATPSPAPSPSPVPTTKATSTPQYLGPLHADIWASPATVSVGSRSSIFWSAVGVLSCNISSSDKSISAATLSGSAPTFPLTQDTTYSIACQSATSSVSNQVIVKVQ